MGGEARKTGQLRPNSAHAPLTLRMPENPQLGDLPELLLASRTLYIVYTTLIYR